MVKEEKSVGAVRIEAPASTSFPSDPLQEHVPSRGPQRGGDPPAAPRGRRSPEGLAGLTQEYSVASAFRGFVQGGGPAFRAESPGQPTNRGRSLSARRRPLALPHSPPSPRGGGSCLLARSVACPAAACPTGRKGERGGSPRCTLKVRRVGGVEAHPPGQAGPPALEAVAFRPIAGLGLILRSARSYQAERASSFRPHGTCCRDPQRTSASIGGGWEGTRTLDVPPSSVSRRVGRVSQGGSFRTRGPGLLPRRRPHLCPRLSSMLLGRARVPHWVLRLAHAADPSYLD
ncbi:hypothetical protein NDU88_002461 [Pleurodeles waltl]|uniref:Uncharacterized protein n=1 Tax=Pleurodeles waltl TaxID=8319 RepID=A0AAV7SDU9_PLEWA|nr:hypothetical protein NDU88_002461 [Pleurodeles waltl]